MFKHPHLAIAAIIWPGPINGPLPITLFKFLTPAFILLFGVIPATLIMASLASILVIYFFDEITKEESLDKINKWSRRLPAHYQKALKIGTISAFIPLVFTVGPFPVALAFRLLNFKGAKVKLLLVASCFANSFFWTGVFWGGGIALVESFLNLEIF
ncbi:MAG: hypothetical protein WD231_05395 [Candidatus Woykebacteria bacterium]